MDCVLWTFQEKEGRDLRAVTIWCEILREGQRKKILRGFVMYHEWNPLLMFSRQRCEDLNCLLLFLDAG